MEKYVKLTEKEYNELVETHEQAHQKGQDILQAMADTKRLLFVIDNPYKLTREYTIYGDEPMAFMLQLPLWRIIRAKLNKKKILKKALIRKDEM